MAVFDLAHEEWLELCATPRRLKTRGRGGREHAGPAWHEHLGA